MSADAALTVPYRFRMTDVLCARCGQNRAAAAPIEALTWVCDRQGARTTWLCPTCARTHVRDIEGKLPEAYW
jgi:hypothetical protein